MMELEKLPLTPNGKLDRKNLPEPQLALQTAYTAPRNELEEQLSVIWQEVLGTKQVGIEDSFLSWAAIQSKRCKLPHGSDAMGGK